jgi:GT2 family glycosyltransferase
MIVQVFANLKEEGYLDKARHPTVAPFFAGANVAFRADALRQIGGYDPACMTGEDCDACARLTAADWELYLRRDAVVSHHNPSTLRRLLRQWYGYGRHHPYVFAKHNTRAIEFYGRVRDSVAGQRYIPIFYRRSPLAIVVFITRFLILHFAFIATALLWLVGWSIAGWFGAGLTVGLALAYAWPDLRGWGFFRGTAFAAIRYLADAALFAGAFVGGLHQRMLYFSATVD